MEHKNVRHTRKLGGVAAPALTKREAQIMKLVANGRPSWWIAANLRMAEQTVKNHLTRIYRKLRARNRVQAVNVFMNRV